MRVDLWSEWLNTTYSCVRNYVVYCELTPGSVGNVVELGTPVRTWILEPSFVMMESAGLHMPTPPRPAAGRQPARAVGPRQNRSPCPEPV